MRRGLKDLRDAGLLSFFMLVAAASISFSLGFLVVFVIFLVLGTWMLILNHVVTELERAGQAGGGGAASTRRVFFRGPLTRVSLVAAAITFSLAGGLFFVIPRVGQAALPLRAQLGRMVTGFADRVDLGSFGDIETDHSVVMRVYLTDERVDPVALPELRWRAWPSTSSTGARGRARWRPGATCAAGPGATSGSGCPAGPVPSCGRRSSWSRWAPTRCSARRA